MPLFKKKKGNPPDVTN